jgi:hypothetical protein
VHGKAWFLAGLGRYEDAARSIQEAGERGDGRLLVLQGLLAARAGRADLEPDLDQLAKDEPWTAAWYDGQVHPERLTADRVKALSFGGAAAKVMARAADDPKGALSLLYRFNSFEAAMIPEPVAMLLIGEAWRAGDQAAADMLRISLLSSPIDLPALRRYVVQGEPAQDMSEVRPECPAFHLARARVLRLQGDAAGAAAEERLLRQHDLAGGLATRALESWPPVGPGAPSPAGKTQVAGGLGLRGEAPKPAKKPASPTRPLKVEQTLERVEGLRLEPEP